MNKKNKKTTLRLVLPRIRARYLLLALPALALPLFADTLNFVSYFPSPLGVYSTIVTRGTTLFARHGGALIIGSTAMPVGYSPASGLKMTVTGATVLGSYAAPVPGLPNPANGQWGGANPRATWTTSLSLRGPNAGISFEDRSNPGERWAVFARDDYFGISNNIPSNPTGGNINIPVFQVYSNGQIPLCVVQEYSFPDCPPPAPLPPTCGTPCPALQPVAYYTAAPVNTTANPIPFPPTPIVSNAGAQMYISFFQQTNADNVPGSGRYKGTGAYNPSQRPIPGFMVCCALSPI